MDRATNISELAEFFPAGNQSGPAPVTNRCVVWHKGETLEQAVANQNAKTARIQAQICDKAFIKMAAETLRRTPGS